MTHYLKEGINKMIILYWSYILIGWVVFAVIGFLVEWSIGEASPAPYWLGNALAVSALMLFVVTFLAAFLGIAQLIQPYITVTW